MTETKILELLRGDFKEVKTSVTVMTKEVAGMKSTLKGVNDTLKEHRADIKKTREDQLGCAAKAGWVALKQEIKQDRDKQTAYKGRVRGELQELRGDQTGQTDVPPQAMAAVVTPKTSGTMVAGAFKTFGPWIVAALIGLGVYLGSGGDEAKTLQVLRNLREIGLKVEQIEKNNAEPVRVPVPVTASDLYSEELTP